jgi:putative chitinase
LKNARINDAVKMSDLITKDQLKAILSNAKDENIDRYLAPLNKALARYSINTPIRIAHFIAQVAQESGSFRYNEEIWPNPALDANGVATNGSSWQLRYEGRTELGNTHPGDGYRFRGRGLIQLTGRANYAKYGSLLGRDLTTGANPDLVAQPDLAVDAAGWYWDTRGLNAYADKDDVLSITKRINGGTLGLDSRKAFLAKAKQILGLA